MSPFQLLIIHGMVAMAFYALWSLDRKQPYLFWWGNSHLFQSASIAFSFGIPLDNSPLMNLFVPLHGLSVGMIGACALKGACEYREIRFSNRYMLAFVATVAIAVAWSAGYVSALESRMIAGMPVGAALLAVGILLWPCGRFEKVTAGLMFLRSATIVVFTLVGQQIISIDQRIFLESAPIIISASSLMLLVTAFRHNLLALNSHNELLALSHAISSSVHDVTEEREIAERVIQHLVQLQGWCFGAVALKDAEGKNLESIARSGPPVLHDVLREVVRSPSEKTRYLLKEKQAVYSVAASEDDFFSEPSRRLFKAHGIHSLAILPLLQSDSAFGVLLLATTESRSFAPSEQKTLESVAHVVALALVHARNLRDTRYRADHDLLTRLGNRSSLHKYFDEHLQGRPVTLMLFDLDHFKEVNDALGHAVGDQLLIKLAERLQEKLADEHFRLFRLGGDEFVALYLMSGPGDAPVQVASRLLEVIREPVIIDDLYLQTSAAVGVVTDIEGKRSSHELLRCADLTMYKAKQQDNRLAFYDDSADVGVQRKLQLISDVTRSLEREEFVVHYQPIVELSGAGCRSCEALVRWNHPRRGLVRAGAFMDIVEATNLIRPLTYKVIDRVVEDLASWRLSELVPKVSINLSTRNLLDRELWAYLLDTCRASSLDPELLQFEITETVLMQDPKVALEFLIKLRNAGFGIALDDFGTGFSSLSYLSKFPISVLKIDGCFISGIREDLRNLSIVEAAIGLAHNLGISTTAEGVEHREEDRIIRDLNCDQAQGYFYSEPLAKPEFEAWLAAYNHRAKVAFR